MKKIYLSFVALFLVNFALVAQHPSAGGYKVYYGHVHNYTGYSDGEGNPSDAYRNARDVAGLDFMGISDHAIQVSPSEWNNLKNTANSYNADGSFTTF